MPRTGRVVLAGYPHHVVQRGHDRKPVFARDADYLRYLNDLMELKQKYDVQVFGYCLMTNHVHLLLQPDEPASLGRLMKALAGRATRYRNRLERRTGTLWEGRYKSSPVQVDRYLLACCRYIELNPVRAGLVDDAGAYRWSSYRQHVDSTGLRWIDPDPAYMALSATEAGRAAGYRRYVLDDSGDGERQMIRQALQRGQLTGGRRFSDEVAAILGRRVANRGPGRPGKTKEAG